MNNRDKPSHDPVSVFNDLRLEGTFCDAVIKVEDIEFPVHKIILCRCSEYFQALFKRWSAPDKKLFHIPGLSADMMQLIIEFAYTGSVSVTEGNVQELLLAADQFNVMDIVQTCCDFVGKQLSPENCIGIFQFTNVIFCYRLQCKAYRYITEHFEQVAFTDEFLQLSVEELKEFLGRDDLSVRKESMVFEAVLRWIAHVPEERKGHIAELLSKVRLALTNMDYIKMNVVSNELVKSHPKCQPIVKEAMEIVSHMKNRPLVSGFCNPVARPRLPNAILLAIGGWSGGIPTNCIEAYDIRTDYWLNLTNHRKQPRAYHGTAFLRGHVYWIGGIGRENFLKSVRRYNLGTHTWHEVAPMHVHRCYVSVTVLNECIYAVGGYDGNERLNTTERYCPDTNQWSFIARMHEHRSDASCTTLHNKVYICGGFNGNECLQTAECYNPETDQWTMIAPMNSHRSGLGVMAYADRVYAVGGSDGTTRLRSAEAYNPHTNTWHDVSTMITPRSNFGIEVLEDKLFVVGGYSDRYTSHNVEYYDATTDEWTEACDMGIFRSAVSCCVASTLPNLDDYIVPRNVLPPFQEEVSMELEESA